MQNCFGKFRKIDILELLIIFGTEIDNFQSYVQKKKIWLLSELASEVQTNVYHFFKNVMFIVNKRANWCKTVATVYMRHVSFNIILKAIHSIMVLTVQWRSQ